MSHGTLQALLVIDDPQAFLVAMRDRLHLSKSADLETALQAVAARIPQDLSLLLQLMDGTCGSRFTPHTF
jgi:hypothetical protein